MKTINIKEKVISILSSNKNTYLTCRNIQHLIHSKWGKMPKDGTVSSILFNFHKNNLLERQENIGRNKGYGYKLNFPNKISAPEIIKKKQVSNSITTLQLEE